MYVRLLYLVAIIAGLLLGTVGEQLLALAVAGVLVARHTLVVRTHPVTR